MNALVASKYVGMVAIFHGSGLGSKVEQNHGQVRLRESLPTPARYNKEVEDESMGGRGFIGSLG